MADTIAKFLKKLTIKDKEVLIKIIEDILQEKVEKYDLKRLVGNEDVFRIRKGRYRIIFRRYKKEIEILEVDCRSESTYKEY